MRMHITRALSAFAAVAALVPMGLAGAPGAVAGAAPGTSLAHPVTAYVANYVSNTVTPVNTATHHAGRAIKVGQNPIDIAITPNG